MREVRVIFLSWLVAYAFCFRFQVDSVRSDNVTESSPKLAQLQRDGIFTNIRRSHRSGLQHASGHVQKSRRMPSMNGHSVLQLAKKIVNETEIDTPSVDGIPEYFVWFRYDTTVTGNKGAADGLHIELRTHQLEEMKGMKELKGGGSGQFVGVYEMAEQGAVVAKQMSLNGTEKEKDAKEVKNALLPAELKGYDKLPKHPHISAERKKVGLPLHQLVCQVGPIRGSSPELIDVVNLILARLTEGETVAGRHLAFQRSEVLRDTVLKAAQEFYGLASLTSNVKMYMVAPFVKGGVVGNALADMPQDMQIQSALIDTIVDVLIARIADCERVKQPEELYGGTLGKKFTERTSVATRDVLSHVSAFFLRAQTEDLLQSNKTLGYNDLHVNGHQKVIAYSKVCIRIAEHLEAEGDFLSKFVSSHAQHFLPAWGSPPLHTDANMQNLVFNEGKKGIKFVDNAASAGSIQALSLELFKLNFGYTHSGNLAKKFPCKVRMTKAPCGNGTSACTGDGSSKEEPSIVLAPEALDTFERLLKGERQFINRLKARMLSSPHNKDIMAVISRKLVNLKDTTPAVDFIKTLFAQGLLYALMQRVSDTGYAVEGQMREALHEFQERKIGLKEAAYTLIGLVNRCLANMNMYFRQKYDVFKDLLEILGLPDGSRLLEQIKFPYSPFAAMRDISSSPQGRTEKMLFGLTRPPPGEAASQSDGVVTVRPVRLA